MSAVAFFFCLLVYYCLVAGIWFACIDNAVAAVDKIRLSDEARLGMTACWPITMPFILGLALAMRGQRRKDQATGRESRYAT